VVDWMQRELGVALSRLGIVRPRGNVKHGIRSFDHQAQHLTQKRKGDSGKRRTGNGETLTALNLGKGQVGKR